MMQRIYADNAATTKLDYEAFEVMRPYLLEEYGNAAQPYSFARTPKKALQEARSIIAKCINASPSEIYFTSGGTESDNWAIKGTALGWKAKDHIVTSMIEHHAVLKSCGFLEEQGYAVTYLPVNRQAIIDKATLASTMTERTHLVSIMTVNNEVGTIQMVRELVETAHTNGAIFHTDAVQAIGHMNVDVKETDVDLLSASAHKFNGPKGVGFLYIKSGLDIGQYQHGGSQENGLRAGTENVAAIIGMAVALRNNYNHIRENTEKIKEIENAFISSLTRSKIDYIINGGEHRIPGIINISIKNADGEMLLHRLDLMGITISTGAACDSQNTQISHVIQAIGVPNEYARGTIRVSFGKENRIDDAVMIVKSIERILSANDSRL